MLGMGGAARYSISRAQGKGNLKKSGRILYYGIMTVFLSSVVIYLVMFWLYRSDHRGRDGSSGGISSEKECRIWKRAYEAAEMTAEERKKV